ncbi:MAG: Rieske 2Fe-2S domain-containing protein [Candidatus Binataceae bacterium]
MGARLPHIGTYRRELPVSLERLYENAIDWEHLPYLHRTTFSRIEPIDAGKWGFRARVWSHPHDERRAFVIELKLNRDCRRWITSTLDGPGTGTEIWTHAFSTGERRTMIVVDFFVPGASDERVPKLAEYYQTVYARLYDEDVEMMTTRERELDRVRDGSAPRAQTRSLIGGIADIRARLPLDLELDGRRFRIVEIGGDLIAYSTRCPHSLGPLGDARLEGGTIECPWHGYRFDIRTGRCVSGAPCNLAPSPAIRIDPASGDVIAEWSSARAE